MRLHPSALSLVLLLAVGCAPAAVSRSPAEVQRSNRLGPIASDAARAAARAANLGTLAGKLAGPTAGLVANNAGSLVSDNGAGIVTNNSGSLVAKNAGSWRVLALQQQPIAGARVAAYDERGQRISEPAITDANGAFTLHGLAPSGPVVVVRARYRDAGRPLQLAAIVAAPRGEAPPDVGVDTSTTLVARAIGDRAATGSLALAEVHPETAAGMARAVAPFMSDRAAVAAALLEDASANAILRAIASQSPALATQLEALGAGTNLAGLASASARPTPSPSNGPGSPSAAPSGLPATGIATGPSPGGSPAPQATSGPEASANASGRPAAIAAWDFTTPFGLAVAAGSLYVADAGNNTLVALPIGAGSGTSLGGPYDRAAYVAVDAAGNCFVSNRGNGTVSKRAAGGGFTAAFVSGLQNPTGLALDGEGNLYVADAGNSLIAKVSPTGNVQPFASSGLDRPMGLARDAVGNLYVADGPEVKKIAPNGSVSTFAGGMDDVYGLAIDPLGNLLAVDHGDERLVRITPSGAASTIAHDLDGPTGVAVDATTGAIYVSLGNRGRVMQVGARETARDR